MTVEGVVAVSVAKFSVELMIDSSVRVGVGDPVDEVLKYS